MEEKRKYENFQEFSEYMRATSSDRTVSGFFSKLLKPGKNAVRIFLEEAKRRADISQDLIDRVRDRAMMDGSFELTYEGAERIYGKIRDIVRKAGEKSGQDYLRVFDAFDPVTDHDLIATGIFCLVPEVREYVKNNSDTLYKVRLVAHSKSRHGYSLPTRKKTEKETPLISEHIESLIKSLPQPKTDVEAENQRKLRVLLNKKAERETFPVFKKNPQEALRTLAQRIAGEDNQNLREAYQRLATTYHNYIALEVRGVNPDFVDPNTGDKGVLPSLHQRSAIYHLMNEKRLGVFDGCGTGKTAIAVLAAPLIREKLGDPNAKILVACPNAGKKAWKRGLLGDDTKKYLAGQEKVVVINGERKNGDLLKKIKEANWVILNYEQLIARVNGGESLLVDELEKMGFKYVIFDESHHIRSHRTLTPKGKPTLSAAAQRLARNAEYLALLTASPIPDRLEDYGVMASLLQPNVFSNPESLKVAIENNPRILYTFFNEKTVRRTAEDINDELDWREGEESVELTPEQRKLYEHIIEFRPSSWLTQARKALLDPRLVDPEILRRAGVLGKVTERSSAKYLKLEELLTSNKGPVAKGDKFIIFSSMFREGVTQKEHQTLKARYEELGIPQLYDGLHLERNLEVVIKDAINKRFSGKGEIGVIDGTIIDIEERERIVDHLSRGLAGILCTTETGGESLDFTPANHVYFLDEDYTPKTSEQALSRVLRKGQKKKVSIVSLMAKGTLDEQLRDYVDKKRILTKTAIDGHPLTKKEWDLLEDTEGKRLVEMVKKGIGGISIDTSLAEINEVEDFEIKKRVSSSRSRSVVVPTDYDTTDAQRIMQFIGQDPRGCWFNPEFVELYMKTLPNLAVPVMHKAKITDLIRRASENEIAFPRIVLSDGSGPSLLYNAYEALKQVVEKAGYSVPKIVDRDISPLMIAKGNNPNKVLGNMNGKDSTLEPKTFDMVDNESITLLPKPEEVKQTLLESHRLLKDRGLLELVVKNMRFTPEFYLGLEKLGFEPLTEKNQGFAVSPQLFQRLRREHGEHFAESYAAKLAQTYMILARKTDNPSENVKAEDFWFEHIVPEENQGQESQAQEPVRDPTESRSIITPRGRRRSTRSKRGQRILYPDREIVKDKFGNIISVKKIGGENE